jgi:hypothetical protein
MGTNAEAWHNSIGNEVEEINITFVCGSVRCR